MHNSIWFTVLRHGMTNCACLMAIGRRIKKMYRSRDDLSSSKFTRNMNKYELTNIISNIDNHITIHLPQINKKHKEIYKIDVFTLLIVCLILYLLTF